MGGLKGFLVVTVSDGDVDAIPDDFIKLEVFLDGSEEQRYKCQVSKADRPWNVKLEAPVDGTTQLAVKLGPSDRDLGDKFSLLGMLDISRCKKKSSYKIPLANADGETPGSKPVVSISAEPLKKSSGDGPCDFEGPCPPSDIDVEEDASEEDYHDQDVTGIVRVCFDTIDELVLGEEEKWKLEIDLNGLEEKKYRTIVEKSSLPWYKELETTVIQLSSICITLTPATGGYEKLVEGHLYVRGIPKDLPEIFHCDVRNLEGVEGEATLTLRYVDEMEDDLKDFKAIDSDADDDDDWKNDVAEVAEGVGNISVSSGDERQVEDHPGSVEQRKGTKGKNIDGNVQVSVGNVVFKLDEPCDEGYRVKFYPVTLHGYNNEEYVGDGQSGFTSETCCVSEIVSNLFAYDFKIQCADYYKRDNVRHARVRFDDWDAAHCVTKRKCKFSDGKTGESFDVKIEYLNMAADSSDEASSEGEPSYFDRKRAEKWYAKQRGGGGDDDDDDDDEQEEEEEDAKAAARGPSWAKPEKKKEEKKEKEKKPRKCTSCHGKKTKKCHECNGKGDHAGARGKTVKCSVCKGKGTVNCMMCKGTGELK